MCTSTTDARGQNGAGLRSILKSRLLTIFCLSSSGTPSDCSPEFLRSEPRALDQGLEFGPGYARCDGAGAGEGIEAAVRAGNDVFATDDAGETYNTLRDDLRVFDVVGAGIDQARDEDLPLRQADLLEDLPFMFVARIGGFEGERAALDLEQQV